MDKDKISQIISGYAAIVSTMSMTLGIINYVKSNRIIIKVKMSFENKFSLNGFEGFYLRATITNQSEKDCTIKSVNISLAQEVNTELGKGKEFYLPNSEISFPITLKRGEEKIINLCNLNSLHEKMLTKIRRNTKMSIVTVDTMDKRYYSKKVKSDELKKIIEQNCDAKVKNLHKKCLQKGLIDGQRNVFVKFDYTI